MTRAMNELDRGEVFCGFLLVMLGVIFEVSSSLCAWMIQYSSDWLIGTFICGMASLLSVATGVWMIRAAIGDDR